MSNLFIHKPLGASVGEATRKILAKKYTGYWEFCVRKENDKGKLTWFVPEKITMYRDFEDEAKKEEDSIFSQNCETIIHMCSTNSPKDKETSIFIKGDERDNHPNQWLMGLVSVDADKCFKESWQGLKYSGNNAPTKSLREFMFKHLSNASILSILKLLNAEYKLESVVVSNGILSKFLNSEYEDNGVFFSNFAHEDNLPSEMVTKLATILTWILKKDEKELDIKGTFAKLITSPHRMLTKMATEKNVKQFVEQL